MFVYLDGKPWSIYSLADPRDGSIRYIGKTEQSPEKRLRSHKSAARTGSRFPVHIWMRELWKCGLLPILTVLEAGTGDWEIREKEWITAYRSSGVNLLNISEGGRLSNPPAVRQLIKEKLKRRIFTPEHRRRISEAKRGTRRPDLADKNKTSGAHLKEKKLNISEEERERRRIRGRNAKAFGNLIPGLAGKTAEERHAIVCKSWVKRKERLVSA